MRSPTILRVRGIPIRVHWSLIAMIVYLAWVFSARFSTLATLTGKSLIPPLAWGLVIAIGLFVGVALHELGHALLARALGGRVHRITLTFIGGVSEITEMPPRPMGEAAVAFAGPLVSFVLALGAALIGHMVPTRLVDLRFALGLLGRLNFVIALFNLIPAFPLDGGRLLRSLLLRRLGASRATRTAASIGKAFAVVLGVLAMMGNWVLLFIALFLWVAADSEVRGEAIRAALRLTTVGELMDPMTLEQATPPGLPVSDVAEEMLRNRRTYSVVASPTGLYGIVRATDVRHISPDARFGLTIAQVAHPVPTISLGQSAEEALRTLEERGSSAAVVLGDGSLVGVLTRDAILRCAELIELSLHRLPFVRPPAPARP